MRLVTLPGVFRPIADGRLLAACMQREIRRGAEVADICTGSGILAVAAARAGARVTAVDVSRRAVLSARINARLNGVSVRAVRGDLLAPLAGERFDVIVSNPPYVPTPTDTTPTGAARAWEAGRDGRRLLDRICEHAPRHLRPGGVLLLVHSSVCGERLTVERLRRQELHTDVVARRRGRLGPLLSRRAGELERAGLLEPGEREEELLVVRGRRPAGRH
jgi:release factor glutamine methyltransferase